MSHGPGYAHDDERLVSSIFELEELSSAYKLASALEDSTKFRVLHVTAVLWVDLAKTVILTVTVAFSRLSLRDLQYIIIETLQ